MKDIIDYYNRHSYKDPESTVICHNPIDPSLLWLEISLLLDQKLFNMYNGFFFPNPNNLN
jgi:hypothetical protein